MGAEYRRWPIITPALAGVAVVGFVVPGFAAWLQYDRQALFGGQLWRLITCHWTHWSATHLWWDVVVFVILGVWCEHESRRRWMVCLIASVLLIPLTLWPVLSDMQTYRGLSGLDTALFTLLAVMLIRRSVRLRQWLIVGVIAAALLGLTVKTIWEMATHTPLFAVDAAVDMVPVPLAHIVGGAIGVIVACIGDPPMPNELRTPW